MGAYLTAPNRDKESINRNCEAFSYGASSMQGWRISQEDAHNCCPDFDSENNTSLFAVYDGHGGAEVAQYTGQHFPDFLKKTKQYKEGFIAQALEDAFLAFDETLTEDSVIETLKELAGLDEADEDEEEQQNEVAGLCEEAEMPIEKLMERYGASNKSFKNLRDKGDDFQSPALRPKHDGMDKIEAEHIKQNMSNKLINGNHDDGNGSECVTNADSADALKEKNKKTSGAANVDSTVDSIEREKENGAKGDREDCTPQTNSSTLPDSTQTDSKTDTSASNSASQNTDSKVDNSNSAAEVTSSSAGSTASGGSGSSAVSGSGDGCSEAASSGAAGGSAGSSAGCVSEEPSSSSGRKRSKRSGVIPAEGEDESSYDEDETSDSEDELDENDITESDSEDEDMAGFPVGMAEDDEEEDEDDDERGVVYGGEEPGSDSGCTAVVAVLRGKELHVGNAGDSRCVVCRDGKAIDMSIDHKPEDELERKRIERAGGQVTEDNRVNGGLNLSRAIGDHVYKKNADLSLKEQMISPLPDIKSLTLTDQDEFIVLACDGIWNVMSSQDVCVFVRDRFKAGVDKISDITEEMFDFCMAPDTTGDGTGCDNMTCIIVKLHHTNDSSQSTAVKRRASDNTELEENKKTKAGD